MNPLPVTECGHLAITPLPCLELEPPERGVTAWHMVRDKLMLGPIMSREMSQSQQPGIYNPFVHVYRAFLNSDWFGITQTQTW